MSENELKELHAELAQAYARVASLERKMAALENIVYKKQTEKTERLPVQKILEDLEVSLSDRLEVVNENEVKARGYFHQKDDWSTINKLLKQNGFDWVSAGKQSCWRRKK